MNMNSLYAEREHLANLLEATQRCAHFLHAEGRLAAGRGNAAQPALEREFETTQYFDASRQRPDLDGVKQRGRSDKMSVAPHRPLND